MRAAVSMLLELAPFTKVLYSSDANLIPELFALGAQWGRTVLGDVLDAAIQDGDLSAQEAEEAARAILHGNAEARTAGVCSLSRGSAAFGCPSGFWQFTGGATPPLQGLRLIPAIFVGAWFPRPPAMSPHGTTFPGGEIPPAIGGLPESKGTPTTLPARLAGVAFAQPVEAQYRRAIPRGSLLGARSADPSAQLLPASISGGIPPMRRPVVALLVTAGVGLTVLLGWHVLPTPSVNRGRRAPVRACGAGGHRSADPQVVLFSSGVGYFQRRRRSRGQRARRSDLPRPGHQRPAQEHGAAGPGRRPRRRPSATTARPRSKRRCSPSPST